MSDQRSLMIWAGGGGAVILLGLILTWTWRGPVLTAQERDLKKLGDAYRKLYHPDKPNDGRLAPELLAEVGSRAEHQQAQLDKAREQLVVAVPPAEYLTSDLVAAQGRVGTDVRWMEQRAQSFRVQHAALPFTTIDQTEAGRSRQLMHLLLVRTVFAACIEAGLPSISRIQPGGGVTDPSGAIAMFPCDFTVAGTPAQVQDLLLRLRALHPRGVGLRACELGHDRDSQRLLFTASLLVANRPEWQLGAERGAVR
jgi:hypothetical protein